MGDEADADWQAGLVERGIEDAKNADADKAFGWRCPKCDGHYFTHAIKQGRPVCPTSKQR